MMPQILLQHLWHPAQTHNFLEKCLSSGSDTVIFLECYDTFQEWGHFILEHPR